MNRFMRQWSLFAAIVGFVLLAGCSPKKDQPEAPAASSQTAPRAGAPSGEPELADSAEAEHGDSTEAVAPAATIGEIWMQIGNKQDKLSAAIQNGQLKDVHNLAFGIRGLVVALANKANAASPASAPRLNGMVEQVKASAVKLDQFGDAGNQSGTQAEYAKFEAILVAINRLTGGK